MSLNPYLLVKRIASPTKKSLVVAIFIFVSAFIFIAVIRPSWSSNISFSNQQISYKWEEMFQAATAAVIANTLSSKKHIVDCDALSTDWDAHSSCQLSHDFGGVMMDNPAGLAGQKAVCIDPRVAPKPGKCLVYSFGIQDDWSFDETMARYGCEVFAFDPSTGMTSHDHSPGNIHFHDWGLGDRDEYDHRFNWTIRSLTSIYKSLDKEASLEEHRVWAKLLRSLEKMGMVRFDSEYNPWYVGNFTKFPLSAPLGYEIAWYNSNLLHPMS